MMPVVFEGDEFYEQWRSFLEKNYNHQLELFGDPRKWQTSWDKFWSKHPNEAKHWNKAVKAYWEALNEGKQPDSKTLAVLATVKSKMVELIQQTRQEMA